MEEYRNMAIEMLGKITHVEERENAFVFYNDEIKQDGCVVILKGDEKILTMTEYIILYQGDRG